MTFLVRVSISAELLFFGVGCRPAGLSVGQGWGRHIGLRGIQGESRLVTFLPWKFVAPETLDSKLRHFARWKKTRLLWRTTNFPNFGAFELNTYSICFCSRRTYDNVKVHIYVFFLGTWVPPIRFISWCQQVLHWEWFQTHYGSSLGSWGLTVFWKMLQVSSTE